jgi:two-component system LytT family response regulator
MIINCIVIEDEPLAMERVVDYVGKVPYLNLIGSFDNGLEAIGFLKDHKVDLIYLDIKMDELTGIQLIESMAQKPEIIITTAFHEYALKGFELSVADYLLKPYSFDRFLQASDKVYHKLFSTLKTEKNYLFVKTEYRMEKVLYDDILYIEGMRDYRSIQKLNHKILTLQTFTELEEELPENVFCRVHKSYIVAISKIESIERNRIRIRNKLIPVSETYRQRFNQLIGLKK